MRAVEHERRLAFHPKRRGIDHEIQYSLAVVEGKIGRFGEMRQRHGMMLAIGGEFIENSACLGRIASDKDQSEAFIGQCRNNGPRRAAGAYDSSHAEQVLARQQGAQRFEEAACIGVVTHQRPVALPHHRIDRADARSQRIEPVEQRQDCLLVRHGDIRAAPGGIGAVACKKRCQLALGYGFDSVFGIDPALLQPEAVDQRRSGVRHRITDDERIGSRTHAPAASEPPSTVRSASSTCSSGMPSIVNWSPMIRSNRCTPRASMRKPPTQAAMAGHSASR